jgi:hypothetical protein
MWLQPVHGHGRPLMLLFFTGPLLGGKYFYFSVSNASKRNTHQAPAAFPFSNSSCLPSHWL